MRFLCASLALGVGLLVMVPEPAHAWQRRGGSIRYSSAPIYSSDCQPMYYAPGGYYIPNGYSGPRAYAPQYPSPYQPIYPPPTAMPAAPTTNAVVNLTDNKFEPATITIAPGTTIRWTNTGTHKHTVTSATGIWDSGDLAPGQVYVATFSKPGTYEYFCRHHKDMRGSIIVK